MAIRVRLFHVNRHHFGAYAGIAQFIRHLPPDRIDASVQIVSDSDDDFRTKGLGESPWFRARLKGWIQGRGQIWYKLSDLAAERRALRPWFRGELDLLHFVDGEHTAQFLPLLAARFRSRGRTMATYHQPAAILPEVIAPGTVAALDHVTVVASSQRSWFERFLPAERISVVLHGVDAEFFRPAPEPPLGAEIRCLTVGSYLRDWRMLRAVAERLVDRPEIRFDVCSASATDLTDLPNVMLHRSISDDTLLGLYQNAHILLLPLTDATANNAFLEGMACGLPVVATDLPSLREYAGQARVRFVPHDAAALADAVTALAADPAARAELGATGRRRARELAWPGVARGYCELYERVLRERGRDRPRARVESLPPMPAPPPLRPVVNPRPPRITVIVPARNAESTIAETLASLAAQTVPDWTAIVVDDGSTDRTREIAQELAAGDTRIEVLARPALGVSAARNAALDRATTEFIHFLDSDDLIHPALYEKTLAKMDATGVDLVQTMWARLPPDGTLHPGPYFPIEGDGFQVLARVPAFTVHSCLIRRETLDRAGRFEASLVACEDWDLFQRFARRGARITGIEEVLAYYRIRPRSASQNYRRMLDDGLIVLRRGHGRDPRVTDPAPANRAGRDATFLMSQSLLFACWSAGLAIGVGVDPSDFLTAVGEGPVGDLDPHVVGNTLVNAIPLPSCRPVARVDEVLPDARPLIDRFLTVLERRVGTPHFARRSLIELDRLAGHFVGPTGTHVLAARYQTTIDVSQPVPEWTPLPEAIERFIGFVVLHGRKLGTVELPVFDGGISGLVLTDAIVADFAWLILESFLIHQPPQGLVVAASEQGVTVTRGEVTLARDSVVPEGVAPDAAWFGLVGWHLFLQELWGRPEATQGDFYSGGLAAEGPPRVVTGLSVPFEVSAPVVDLETSGPGLTIGVTVGGAPLGRFYCPAVAGRISAGSLIARVISDGGLELLQLVVREGLLDPPRPDGTPLRERLAAKARTPRPAVDRLLPNGGLAVSRHPDAPIASPAVRHASLPAAERETLERLAAGTGQRIRWFSGSAETGARAAYIAGRFPLEESAGSVPPGVATPARELDSAPSELAAEARYRAIIDAVGEDLGGDRVLEIGCGDGALTKLLAGAAREVVAFDREAAQVDVARARTGERPNVELSVRDGRQPLPSGPFDLIVSGGAVRSLSDRAALDDLAHRISRVLAPRGRFIVLLADPGHPGPVSAGGFHRSELDTAFASRGSLLVENEPRTAGVRARCYRHEGALPARRPPTFRSDLSEAASIPILMYHRVATDGPRALAPYRVAPDQFAEQIGWLRERGYQDVTVEEWDEWASGRRALPGRSVILTFDDAYEDFATAALPVLLENGFSATVFPVAGLAGRTSEWDASCGPTAPLLDWGGIRQLQSAGIRIGSHSYSHPPLAAIHPRDMVRELFLSRAVLKERLGTAVDTIAYPFGSNDGVVRHLVGAAGYRYAFTTEPARAGRDHHRLGLPRVDVPGSTPLAEFARSLGEEWPHG